MISGLSHKTKQFFFVLIKLSIIVSLAYFIYYKITKNQKIGFDVFIAILNKNNVFSTKNVVFLLFLLIFNWFIEILKWKYLVSLVHHISVFDVVVKSGVALFLFSFVDVDELTILSIAMLVLLFNVILSSVYGNYYVLKFSHYKVVNLIANLE